MAPESRAEVPAPLAILNRTSLRDQTVIVLREMVVDGVLAPGDRINEVELAAQLGISRGPLREAIQRLAAEDLLEFRQNRGVFVRTVTLDDVRQMYEVRLVIEVRAAMLAATKATPEEIARLQDLVTAAEEVLQLNSSGPYPSDLDLHMLILELSNNSYLQRIGSDLEMQLQIARMKSGSFHERAREALMEHQLIIAAIANRDVEAAAQAMADHLQKSLDHVVALEEVTTGAE
jgi:DNA-binding GntR family transcriptional regulator